jgi:hypothetical protein
MVIYILLVEILVINLKVRKFIDMIFKKIHLYTVIILNMEDLHIQSVSTINIYIYLEVSYILSIGILNNQVITNRC